MTKFLTVADVLASHDVLIKCYGEAPGVRDMRALEPALYRPQTGYYEDVIQEASALWESLSQTHPFTDGDKRVAFAVVDTFFRINHLRLAASPQEAETFIYGLFDDKAFRCERLKPWLRAPTKNLETKVKQPIKVITGPWMTSQP